MDSSQQPFWKAIRPLTPPREAATWATERIGPLENGPLAVLEHVLDDFVIDGVSRIERYKGVHVGTIECFDPGTHDLTRSPTPSIAIEEVRPAPTSPGRDSLCREIIARKPRGFACREHLRWAICFHRIRIEGLAREDASPRTARAQRKPRYPKTNKMITTAPTSQMILFMIPIPSDD